jgi:hypothetical protein
MCFHAIRLCGGVAVGARRKQGAAKVMTVLPSLVLYWLKDGGEDNYKVPPLEDILNYSPYPAYVSLFAGHLERSPDGNVGIYVPPEIVTPLNDGVGKELQNEGIKVVLSIFSHWEDENKTKGVGWSTLTVEDNACLANQIRELHEGSYHIDGIDIDDEYGPVGEPENFYDTIFTIHSIFPNLVISNPIGTQEDQKHYQYKPYPKSPSLADLMTYCATMTYGDLCKDITDFVQIFSESGIPKEKLYVGVRPGPAPRGNFTSIDACKDVALWAKKNCAGVMMFTFSTDTVEFAGADHAWQKAITSVLTANK